MNIQGYNFLISEKSEESDDYYRKPNKDIYYNVPDPGHYVLEELSDNLLSEEGIVLYVSPKEYVITFANNFKKENSNSIELLRIKDKEEEVLRRLINILKRYTSMYSKNNIFHIVTDNEKFIPKELLDVNLKFKIIDKKDIKASINSSFYAYSKNQRIQRLSLVGIIAISTFFLGNYFDNQIKSYMENFSNTIAKDNQSIRSMKKETYLENKKIKDIKEKLAKIVHKNYTQEELNQNILEELRERKIYGNFLIKNSKIVTYDKKEFKNK